MEDGWILVQKNSSVSLRRKMVIILALTKCLLAVPLLLLGAGLSP